MSGASFTGNVSFGDNDKAIFGAGSDLQIYHDASNSRILENGTGFLAIGTNGGEISLRGDSFNDYMLKAEQNSAVTLYHNALPKLATTSTGIDVTGTADVSSEVLVGNSDSRLAENGLRFLSSGAAFIDHGTTGQNINFRLSNSSSLDLALIHI